MDKNRSQIEHGVTNFVVDIFLELTCSATWFMLSCVMVPPEIRVSRELISLGHIALSSLKSAKTKKNHY